MRGGGRSASSLRRRALRCERSTTTTGWVLLVPSDRTLAGHRLYSEGDVERLYRVLALRHVGLPLSEIGRALDGDTPDLVSTVRRHLARLERALERGHRLHARLSELLNSLQRSIAPSVEQFIDTLEAMARDPGRSRCGDARPARIHQ